jgi:1-acyl-sn-glycerol-3-phosphate acyltransferase
LTATTEGRANPLAGRLRVAVRLTAILALLLASLALYYAWRATGATNPWPRRFLGAMAWVAGARVRTTGAVPRGGAVILANHLSWLDILVLAGATGTAFVAHAGLAENRWLKWLCDMNHTVFVTRSRRGSVAEQVAQVRAGVARSGLLAIFPEGTTSDGRTLLPFKSSLLSALDPPPEGVVVQPVAIDYGAAAPDIAWVGDERGVANFFQILARPGTISITLRFAAPFAPAGAGGRKAIAAEARARVAAVSQRLELG